MCAVGKPLICIFIEKLLEGGIDITERVHHKI
jgi:hypothetical protein